MGRSRRRSRGATGREHPITAQGEGGSPKLRNLILFDTGATWDGPWMAFQHIATYLAKRTPVLFIDAPRSPVHALRYKRRLVFRSRLVAISHNLYRLSPAAPPGWSRPGIRHLTGFVVRRAVKRAVAQLDAEVHAVLSNNAAVNLFDIGDAKVRVYYVSDDFEAGADLLGRPVERMVARDTEGVAGSDVIVAISERIAEKFRARGHEVVLVPNGVAADVFADVDELPRPSDVHLPAPIAGYIGHIGDRIDISLLEATAEAGVSILLVGPRQGTFSQDARLTRLLERPNVQWIGPKPFAELPPYVGMMDVGLVPYVDSAFNRASFPLKTLEYLAAGRPVVATPLPAISWLASDLIAVAAEPGAFGRAVATAASTSHTPELVAARRSFAASHSWSSRVDQLATILGLDTHETAADTPEQHATGGDAPTVSVTIVNHSARELLRDCLRSLEQHPYTGGRMEIVVVDNASEDGSVEMIRTERPSVVVLAETRRRGYGANQNLAIAASHGDLVLMLNPDAVVHAGTIDRLVASMAWDPRVGAAGGPMVNNDGTIRQDRPHRFHTPWGPLARAFGLSRFRSSQPTGSVVTADGWPSGAACLVRRGVLDELGGFDESFFMYSEDADLFARMVERGYVVAWVEDALVSHPLPVETADRSSRREAEKVTSELRYIRKHFGRRGSVLYRLGIAADASARFVLLSVPGLNRLVQRHGRAAATIRRTQLQRLRHALSGAGDPGLAELAADWNRKHG